MVDLPCLYQSRLVSDQAAREDFRVEMRIPVKLATNSGLELATLSRFDSSVQDLSMIWSDNK